MFFFVCFLAFSALNIVMFCIFSSSFFHVRHIRFPQAPGAPPLLPPGALPLGPPATLTLQLSHPLEPAPKQKDKKEKEAIKKTTLGQK